MESTKLYLNTRLTIQTFSDKTDMSRNEVSRLINCITGQNFFHFVNGFRAREYQLALKENRFPNYSLLGVGLECGFNSKSTFYEAVKKEFGKTPYQIQKEIRSHSPVL